MYSVTIGRCCRFAGKYVSNTCVLAGRSIEERKPNERSTDGDPTANVKSLGLTLYLRDNFVGGRFAAWRQD